MKKLNQGQTSRNIQIHANYQVKLVTEFEHRNALIITEFHHQKRP